MGEGDTETKFVSKDRARVIVPPNHYSEHSMTSLPSMEP